MFSLLAQVPAFIRRSPIESLLVAALLVVLSYVIVPLTADATAPEPEEDRATPLFIAAMQNETVPYGHLPVAKLRGPFYTKIVVASAYNSLPEQTDSTPFITASGTHVRHGVVAANFLPIGTLITIPDYYGDEIFVVEDRMNARYKNNIDIWMESVSEAKKFGRRSVRINVYTGR
jgi:3D (Asp-Asp-Asp) domain-containing protein